MFINHVSVRYKSKHAWLFGVAVQGPRLETRPTTEQSRPTDLYRPIGLDKSPRPTDQNRPRPIIMHFKLKLTFISIFQCSSGRCLLLTAAKVATDISARFHREDPAVATLTLLIRDRRGEIVLHGRSGGHNELLRGRCGNRRGYGCNHGHRCTRGLKLKKKKIAQVKIAKLKSQPRRSRSASHRRSRGASLAAVAVAGCPASNRRGKAVVSATESATERERQTVVRRPASDIHKKRRCEEDAGRHQDVGRNRRQQRGCGCEEEGS